MERLKKLSRKGRNTNRIIISAIILIGLFMGVMCFQYYSQVQDTVKTESYGYMQEISKQMANNISKTMKDNFSVLGTISTVLQNSDAVTYEQLKSVVSEQQQYWGYQKIMLIDENGVAYDDQGRTVALNNDEYIQSAVVGKEQSMSTSQVIDGEDCVVFVIPLESMVVGNSNMVALAASYDLNTFDKILSMTAFDGKGYAHIIRKDGSVVIRSSSKSALETGYNILNSFENAKMNDGKNFDNIKSDIADGKSGQTEFTLGDAREYMIYLPLEEQEWSLLTFVPVEVVNAKSELLLKLTIIIGSAISIAFCILITFLMITFYRNRRKLENIAYIDPVTGGNTIQCFYELVASTLDVTAKPQYALIYTNIEKFKVLNEQFGKNSCDDILRSIDYGITLGLEKDECMGRLFADNFCILVKYTNEDELVKRLDKWHKASIDYIESKGANWLPLIIEFGIFVIGNDTIPIPNMVDRAKLALTESTHEIMGKVRYAIYDEQVRSLLFREKKLEDMMEESLKNNEFQVYLQPKYCTQTETIGGAEALVRWISKTEGMMFPDEFIPLFEKNGFIIQLDFWVFEEVCKHVRKWIDMGLEPVKISVNCSRIHLKNANFIERYRLIAEKYNIPHQVIEIELTENTVFGDVEFLSKIIDAIHEAGFGCSMDDFGSGYSSLNLIKDIPVDTLKLDKIFFRSGSKDIERTESVVGSIITMSKALNMETVAEGVEEQIQVDMLKRLNCDYLQGYFYAKPMPISQFEKLAYDIN